MKNKTVKSSGGNGMAGRAFKIGNEVIDEIEYQERIKNGWIPPKTFKKP